MRRMGIAKRDLERSPQISEMIGRMYGTPNHPHNPRKSIDDLRFSADPIAIRFLEVYDSLPALDRKLVPLEAICMKAEISPQSFLGCVFLVRQSLSKAESAMVAVNSFPNVVRKMVEYAEMPGGETDRRMLAQCPAVGFLPTPKGASIKVNLFGSGDAFREDDDDDEGGDEPDDYRGFDDAFSGGNKELEKWNEDRRKLLTDGK